MKKTVMSWMFPLVFLAALPVAFAHGMSAEDQATATTGGFGEFVSLGAIHMVTGYDHLLFLFGVVFFLSRFKDILKFVTAFTLGHSVTLIGATFMGIQANYFLIDAVIALTVCYKGFDNLGGFKKWLNMEAPNLLAIVFVFGLIHGFGLSTRLQQITIGSGMDLFSKIIAFNIGVELGQVAALTVILALLSVWRKSDSFTRFAAASNTALILVGGLLFVMQLHGYSHEVDAETYPLNRDDHHHVHEQMDAALIEAMEEADAELMGAHGHDHGPGGHDHAVPSGHHAHEPGGTPHPDHG